MILSDQDIAQARQHFSGLTRYEIALIGIVDALVASGKVDDDRFMDALHVYRTAIPPLAYVEVAEMDGAKPVQGKVRELNAL